MTGTEHCTTGVLIGRYVATSYGRWLAVNAIKNILYNVHCDRKSHNLLVGYVLNLTSCIKLLEWIMMKYITLQNQVTNCRPLTLTLISNS